jgi:hypothetical protein
MVGNRKAADIAAAVAEHARSTAVQVGQEQGQACAVHVAASSGLLSTLP